MASVVKADRPVLLRRGLYLRFRGLRPLLTHWLKCGESKLSAAFADRILSAKHNMETCKEIHPFRKVHTAFTCCYPLIEAFRAKRHSVTELLEIIDKNTEWLSLGMDAFEMYGIRPDNQFEGYGRATESNEIPWHAWITKEYANDEKDYGSGDCKTFREVAAWLAFHLERLHTLRKEEDDSTRIEKSS